VRESKPPINFFPVFLQFRRFHEEGPLFSAADMQESQTIMEKRQMLLFALTFPKAG